MAKAGSSGGTLTINSSGDEIANVNCLYDDIVHALQNTIDSCINSATDRRVYVLELGDVFLRHSVHIFISPVRQHILYHKYAVKSKNKHKKTKILKLKKN